MYKIFFLICFLIIPSCDLPSEANKDCNGDENGLAELDACGVCCGVNNIECSYWNNDSDYGGEMDRCGTCFGDDICCSELCTDLAAINYCNYATDDLFCIYSLCTDYIDYNDNFNCDTNGSPPYSIGDQLGCETLEEEFDICYPNDCGTVKLADFENKNILIIYEFDW